MEKKNYSVHIKTMQIRSVEDFRKIKGAKRNSQHWQLRDHILVSVEHGKNTRFLLYHPETIGSDTGRFNIAVCIEDEGVVFKYSNGKYVDFKGLSFPKRWPNGERHLNDVVSKLILYVSLNN